MISRRELSASLATIAATAGATSQTVEQEPLPLLMVLSFPGHLSPDQIQNIHADWQRLTGRAADLPPLVILQDGAKLEAVLDPRAKDQGQRTKDQ